MLNLRLFAMVSSLVFADALLLFSQATLGTGPIHGVVRDVSHGVVPGAQIELIEIERNFAREARSNEAGIFVFPNIPAVNYKLRIHKPGFEAFEFTEVRLQVGQTGNLEATLRPGELRSVVTVPANSRLVMLQHTWMVTPATVAMTRVGFVRNQAQQSNEARDLGPILTGVVLKTRSTIAG